MGPLRSNGVIATAVNHASPGNTPGLEDEGFPLCPPAGGLTRRAVLGYPTEKNVSDEVTDCKFLCGAGRKTLRGKPDKADLR